MSVSQAAALRSARSLRRRRRLKIALGALALALLPSTAGFGDLGALLARQPGVAARAREHLIASPFGTIHAAMFSLPRPLGTVIPHPPIYALANFDPSAIAASIGAQPLGDTNAPPQFPTVNRKDKRNSLLSRPRAPMPPLPPLLPIQPPTPDEADAALKPDAAPPRFDPYSQYEFDAAPDEPATADVDLPYKDLPPKNLTKGTGKSTNKAFAALAPGGAAGCGAGLFRRRSAGLGRGARRWRPGRAGEEAAGDGAAADEPDATRAKPSPAKARSPAPSRGRNLRPSGWGLPGRPAPRRRNAWPTPSISRRAASRCAGRSRLPRWC